MLIALVIFIVFCFTFVLLFGAPYLPTLKKQQLLALQMLNLKPGQLLIELGCGDGGLLKRAAKVGIYGVGYELNPIMFLIAKLTTFRSRHLIKIRFGNFWYLDWPEADGIYVFMLQKYMHKLDNKIIQSKIKNVKVVSYAFKIPGKKVTRNKGALYLYKY
jgi:SAM-dependent methyltransferase